MSASSGSNVFLRNDTIFGTCQAIGDDFGFNPNWLRVPLATMVVVSPFGAVGAYLALSLLVLLSRSVFRTSVTITPAEDTPAAPELTQANDQDEGRLAA
jgi:phage shock protein C